jgi:hypothetical protein
VAQPSSAPSTDHVVSDDRQVQQQEPGERSEVDDSAELIDLAASVQSAFNIINIQTGTPL